MAALSTSTDLVDELTAWLETNWDADLTVAQWWDRLGLAGWSSPTLPTNAYGRGLSRNDAVVVAQTISSFGALGAPTGIGMLLAGPTIAAHGSPEQIERYVRDVVTGQRSWCQLFSEPGAGSDLAGLQTKAVRDGDEWIINGQKVWTSGGHLADLAILVARSNPEAPKHQGITYFAFDMHQPGVDVRPLREMTGRALFNEVFLTDARVPHDAVISEVNNGWAVANTTLMFERSGLSSGGGGAGSIAVAGTMAGDLEKRAGDFVDGKAGRRGGGTASVGGPKMFIKLAKSAGKIGDASVRQDLMRLHTLAEIGRYNNLRVKAEKEAGREIPGMPNIGKLSMSEMMRLQRDLGLSLLGPAGTLHSYDHDGRAVLANSIDPLAGVITEMALFAQAPPIYGGTDQIQKNILGERVLGLPKEPGIDSKTPFNQMAKNG